MTDTPEPDRHRSGDTEESRPPPPPPLPDRLPPLSAEAKKEITKDIVGSAAIGGIVGGLWGGIVNPWGRAGLEPALLNALLFGGWGLAECLGAVLARNLRIARG